MQLITHLRQRAAKRPLTNLARLHELAAHFVRRAGNAGLTFNLRTSQPVGARNAWAVSRAGAELILGSELTVPAVQEYLEMHQSTLQQPKGAYLGAWRDRVGNWRLDLTDLVIDKQLAVRQGIENVQEAIYHLGRGEILLLNSYDLQASSERLRISRND